MIETDPLAGACDALLDHLPKAAILARYQVAGGQELVSGKFPSSAIQVHRNELAAFAGEVTDSLADISFCSLTYGQLFQHWSGIPALADHVAALAVRFDVGAP